MLHGRYCEGVKKHQTSINLYTILKQEFIVHGMGENRRQEGLRKEKSKREERGCEGGAEVKLPHVMLSL